LTPSRWWGNTRSENSVEKTIRPGNNKNLAVYTLPAREAVLCTGTAEHKRADRTSEPTGWETGVEGLTSRRRTNGGTPQGDSRKLAGRTLRGLFSCIILPFWYSLPTNYTVYGYSNATYAGPLREPPFTPRAQRSEPFEVFSLW
jgi:hypothetical protein